MITSLTSEIRSIQNPALGAILIWRFAVAYTDTHPEGNSPVLPLNFLVLPLLWHNDTFEILKSTRQSTGLHGFADKFFRSNRVSADSLYALPSRAEALRSLTIESMQIGVRHQLITISTSDATVVPMRGKNPRGVAPSLKPMLSNAAKIGVWFCHLTAFEVTSTLKVSF